MLDWLVNEKLVFNIALNISHLFLKALNLRIFSLAALEKLDRDGLSLLKTFFDFK